MVPSARSALAVAAPLTFVYLGGQIVYIGYTLYAKRAQFVSACDTLQAILPIESLPLQPKTPGVLAYVHFSGRVTTHIETNANLVQHSVHDLAIVTASGYRIVLTDAGHLDLLRCNCDHAATDTNATHEHSTTIGHRTVEAAIAESSLVSGVWLLESVPHVDATGGPTLAWAMVALNHPTLVVSRHFLCFGDLATQRQAQLQLGDTLQSIGTLAMLTGIVLVGGGLCNLWGRR